ncbi:MAG: CBS domain-containing protein [Lachnospiraceae bacterium]|nr:CBS domain-containing protein [Lachnospiraceae bacterium]
MNILFFLKPKGDIVYIDDDETMRQVMEKMEHHRFTAVPMISKETGTYLGTVTEGDLLWHIKKTDDFSIKAAEEVKITEIKRHRDNQPVSADADMEDLINKVVQQNFVPVIDSKKTFIGIITRRDVISYLCRKEKE